MASRSLSLAGSAGIRRACAGACLLALLAGCGGGSSSHGGRHRLGGLYGTVVRGPIAPVCRTGTPCDGPASGARLVFEQAGRVEARATAAKDGTYSVSLAAGTYTVTVGQLSVGRGLEPATVRVVAGAPRKRDFHLDTGIR